MEWKIKNVKNIINDIADVLINFIFLNSIIIKIMRIIK